MRDPRRRLVLGALFAVMALVLSACGSDDDGGSTAAQDIATDVGVTDEPCPKTGHPDRGCIYLGRISDLTEGPFRALGVTLTDGQTAFWKRVNDGGGIAGRYDVDVTTYTRDNKYNPQEHVAKLREIMPKILAMAQSLGTPMTIAAKPLMDENDIIAAPASWWSGWAFEDVILESGHNYCFEAMNILDWGAEEFGKPDSLMAVHYPGDYGGDHAAGVSNWAKVNDVAFPAANNVQTTPNAAAGNQDQAVGAIIRTKPDIVTLATGPAEAAEIIGKAVAQGFEGRFLGSGPTYNPQLLESEAADAIKTRYNFGGPWAPWGADTPAHEAMEEAAGDKLPANEGYTAGWIWSYAMQALLEKGVAEGDLTRAGLRELIPDITVDYEGALPDRGYSGEPNDIAVRDSIIAKADDAAPLGSTMIEDFFVGPTAEKFSFTKPCQAVE